MFPSARLLLCPAGGLACASWRECEASGASLNFAWNAHSLAVVRRPQVFITSLVIEPFSSGDSTRSADQTGSGLPTFLMLSTVNTTPVLKHELERIRSLSFELTGAPRGSTSHGTACRCHEFLMHRARTPRNRTSPASCLRRGNLPARAHHGRGDEYSERVLSRVQCALIVVQRRRWEIAADQARCFLFWRAEPALAV